MLLAKSHGQQLLAGAAAVAVTLLVLVSAGANADTSVIIRFAPDIVTFPNVDEGNGSRFVAERSDAEFADENVRDGLDTFDVATFTTIAPWFRHLSGPQYDYLGNEVELIDMTDDYVVTFSDELDVDRLCQALRDLPGVR